MGKHLPRLDPYRTGYSDFSADPLNFVRLVYSSAMKKYFILYLAFVFSGSAHVSSADEPSTDTEAANTEDKAAESLSCDDFPDHLERCMPYECQFSHPFTGETMVKAVVGEEAGICLYVEEMPNGGQMNCRYDPELRTAIAQYYRDVAAAKTTAVDAQVNEDRIRATYTIDGKEVENPLQEAMTNGQCDISGY